MEQSFYVGDHVVIRDYSGVHMFFSGLNNKKGVVLECMPYQEFDEDADGGEDVLFWEYRVDFGPRVDGESIVWVVEDDLIPAPGKKETGFSKFIQRIENDTEVL